MRTNCAAKQRRVQLPLRYVDDNANDRLLIRAAIQQTNTPFVLYEADNLESAAIYFRSHPPKTV